MSFLRIYQFFKILYEVYYLNIYYVFRVLSWDISFKYEFLLIVLDLNRVRIYMLQCLFIGQGFIKLNNIQLDNRKIVLRDEGGK